VNKQLTGFVTLARREMTRVFRIWPQTLLPSVITTTLYFLIFGSFIGSRIGSIDGVRYIDYIIPGLIMMSVITTSYSNVASSVFSGKFQRSIEELMVSPMKTSTILFGFIVGGMIRGCLVGALVTCVSLLFSPFTPYHLFLIVGVMILTSFLFALGGFFNALFAKKFDDISIIPTFVLTPLTYLGGVFYSITLLPGFWQKVSLFNPILYIVNMFRYGFLGLSDIPVGIAFIALILCSLLLWMVCWTMLTLGYGTRS
jgi:ABC-2 type transport system permease protein